MNSFAATICMLALLAGVVVADEPTLAPDRKPLPGLTLVPTNLTRLLDATRESPGNTLYNPGDDITEGLQWCCDHAAEYGWKIGLPPETYKISKTIRTPYRSGFTLVGSGPGLERDHRTLSGVRTVLQWAGEEGGTMLVVTGSNQRIGNFTLDGQGKAGTGLMVDYPAGNRGLGVGKTIFEPLYFTGFETCVQVGADPKTANCDNLTFRWLECQSSHVGYRGVNAMGMDIVIERLINKCWTTGIRMEGGGHLWCQASLTPKGGALLEIPEGAAVGQNNGDIRLSHVKVDAQAGDKFTLVDCRDPASIDIVIDGGRHSFSGTYKGELIKVCGANSVKVRDFATPGGKVVGTKFTNNRGDFVPTVTFDGCRLFDKPELVGDVDARITDCIDGAGRRIPEWPPLVAETVITREPKQ